MGYLLMQASFLRVFWGDLCDVIKLSFLRLLPEEKQMDKWWQLDSASETSQCAMSKDSILANVPVFVL